MQLHRVLFLGGGGKQHPPPTRETNTTWLLYPQPLTHKHKISEVASLGKKPSEKGKNLPAASETSRQIVKLGVEQVTLVQIEHCSQ